MTPAPKNKWSARGPIWLGTVTALGLVGTLAAWSILTELAGAVIAPGVVQVENDRQVVQHPDGGVVGAIRVRDGDRVEEGDLLLSLDGTFLRSELAVVEGLLMELLVRKRRLEAERDMAATLSVDGMPPFKSVTPEALSATVASQQRLLASRRAAMTAELEQLSKQAEQTSKQVEGLEAELASAAERLAIAEDELADREKLRGQGLTAIGDVREAQRALAQLKGEAGRLQASIAEASARDAQIALEGIRITDSRQSDAILELREVQAREIELVERQISLTEQLSRLDVRAPVSGRVFELSVQAVNSVLRPADPVMFIIPEDRPLQVNARIRPADVDQVQAGQTVRLIFSAFDRRTTPEVPGRVRFISADTTTDDRGNVYYEALVEPDFSVERFGELYEVVPGMPVEAFFVTEARTPLEYLVQPLIVYFNRAFREV